MKKTSFLEDLKKEGVGKNRKSSGWVGGVVEGNSLSSKCQESSCILGKDYLSMNAECFSPGDIDTM